MGHSGCAAASRSNPPMANSTRFEIGSPSAGAEDRRTNRSVTAAILKDKNEQEGDRCEQKKRSDMSAKLIGYFNKQPRLGVLSTSGKDGKVDVAVLGSPRMVDEKTVMIALSKNRTFANLQENPNAVFMIMEPGKALLDWKGIRLYLKMKEFSTSGVELDMIRNESAKFVGEEAAKMIYAAVTFEVAEVRPLVDFGQGWERSI